MSNFEDVKIFMKTFRQIVRTKPQLPDKKTMQLRLDLIKEELSELEEAMKVNDLKEIADALTDILYVTYGAGYAYGIDLAKSNIRVNTVCPTFVVTPMTKKFLKNKKFKNTILKNIPLGRLAQTSDVATAVAFLASDASSMITGTSILVDGGWTAI